LDLGGRDAGSGGGAASSRSERAHKNGHGKKIRRGKLKGVRVTRSTLHDVVGKILV